MTGKSRIPGPRQLERLLLVAALASGLVGMLFAVLGLGALAARDPVFAGSTARHLIELATLRFPSELADLLPPSLVLGRALLPCTLVLLVLLGLVRVLRAPLARALARWERGHVVVCGTGRHVAAAVRSLRDAGHRVVLLQPNGPKVQGALEVRGDPSDARELRAVSAPHAHAVIVAGDGDASNLGIGLAVKSLFEGESGAREDPVICVVRIDDDATRENAARWLQNRRVAGVEFRLFAPFRHAARVLLRQHPLAESADVRGHQQINLLLHGTNPLAEQLLLEILANGHYGDAMLRITVLDVHASDYERRFVDRFPEAGRICELSFRDFDPTTPRRSYRELLAKLGDEPVTGVYLTDSALARSLGLAGVLRDALREAAANVPPIFVRTGESTPTIQRLGGTDWEAAPAAIGPGSVSELFTADALLQPRLDDLARAHHEAYLRQSGLEGAALEALPAGQPWSRLPETFKEAARRQADHAEVKLRALGLASFPLSSGAAEFEFSEAEVEAGAALEHLRWMAQRRLEGWCFAAERDDRLRHHPSLIPYTDLSESMKDYDRIALRELPAHIRSIGREIRRDFTVGLIGEPGDPAPDARFDALADELLERLRRENEDRAPVLLSALGDPASRRVARRALASGAFRLRVPWPVSTDQYMALLADGAPDFRELEALADQSFPLAPGEDIGSPLSAFLAERADRLVVIRSGASGDGAGLVGIALERWSKTGKPAPLVLG